MKAKPSNHPQHVNELIWYYEEGRKLSFVVTDPVLDKIGASIQFDVPLRMLERSLARMPRRKRIVLT